MARKTVQRGGQAPRQNQPVSESSLVPVVGLNELFSLPLTALIEADAYGSKVFLEFLQTFAFEQGADGGSDNYGRLRTVTFYYTTTNSAGVIQSKRVEIPWISLVPLPLLSIRDAHMEFEVEVVGVVEQTTKSTQQERKNGDRPSSARTPVPQRRLQARLFRSSTSALPVTPATSLPTRSPNVSGTAASPKTDSASEQVKSRVNMHVQMNMGQSDLPMGIIQLLNLAQEGTLEQPIGAPYMTLSSANGQLVFDEVGETLEVAVFLADERGVPIPDAQVSLTQDQERSLSPMKSTVQTDASGKARALFQVKTLPPQSVELKTIYAKTSVTTEKYALADVSATLNFELRNQIVTK